MGLTAVVIDSREPKWVQELGFDGALKTVTQLEYGDILATTSDGELLVIERKTVDDLLNTIRADRLLHQLNGIARQSRWAYLVVTGSMMPGQDGKVVTDRGSTGWSWAAVQGALITAQELGVCVVQAASDFDLEATVLRLGARRHDSQIVMPARKLAVELDFGEQIIASLPGIGPEKARALIHYCGNAGQALAALTDMSINTLPGVGGITKQKVREALGIEAWAELAIIDTQGRIALIQENKEIVHYVQAGITATV